MLDVLLQGVSMAMALAALQGLRAGTPRKVGQRPSMACADAGAIR